MKKSVLAIALMLGMAFGAASLSAAERSGMDGVVSRSADGMMMAAAMTDDHGMATTDKGGKQGKHGKAAKKKAKKAKNKKSTTDGTGKTDGGMAR